MKIEDLMKPRYEVIADYPGNVFFVGEILGVSGDCAGIGYYGSGALVRSVYKPEKYPHLFKSLAWWEEREEEDMPEYVKMDHRVWRITKWERGVFKNWILTNKVDDMPDSREKGDTGNFASIHWYFKADRSRPATAEEYEQNIKQKQK